MFKLKKKKKKHFIKLEKISINLSIQPNYYLTKPCISEVFFLISIQT